MPAPAQESLHEDVERKGALHGGVGEVVREGGSAVGALWQGQVWEAGDQQPRCSRLAAAKVKTKRWASKAERRICGQAQASDNILQRTAFATWGLGRVGTAGRRECCARSPRGRQRWVRVSGHIRGARKDGAMRSSRSSVCTSCRLMHLPFGEALELLWTDAESVGR